MPHDAGMPVSPIPKRALVVGGGGLAGNAWLIGVIAGLFERHPRPRHRSRVDRSGGGPTGKRRRTRGTGRSGDENATAAADVMRDAGFDVSTTGGGVAATPDAPTRPGDRPPWRGTAGSLRSRKSGLG